MWPMEQETHLDKYIASAAAGTEVAHEAAVNALVTGAFFCQLSVLAAAFKAVQPPGTDCCKVCFQHLQAIGPRGLVLAFLVHDL
jgi:hypothetical protein